MTRLTAILLLVAVPTMTRPVALPSVKWTAMAPSAGAAIGGVVMVQLRGVISPGGWIYSSNQKPGGPFATQVIVASGQPFRLAGRIASSAPKAKFDSTLKLPVETLEQEAVFLVPVKIDAGAGVGRRTVRIEVRYEVCDERVCLPAHAETVTATVVVIR